MGKKRAAVWLSLAVTVLFMRTAHAADGTMALDDTVLLLAAVAVSAVLIAITVLLYKRGGGKGTQTVADISDQSMTAEQKLCALQPLIGQVRAMHRGGRYGFDICPQSILKDKRGFYRLAPAALRGGASAIRPGFSAPERYYSDRAIGPWTDVYALCALILWLLSGNAPAPAFERKEGKPAAAALTEQSLKTLTETIEKGLELNSAQRPSVDALLTSIQTICQTGEPAANKSRKKRAAVLLTVPLLLGLALLICDINYTQAVMHADAGAFAKASFSLEGVPAFYRESDALRSYVLAGMRLDDGFYDEAQQLFGTMGDYKNAPQMVTEARYRQAAALMDSDALVDAYNAFTAIHPYKDSDERIASLCESIYKKALAAYQARAYADAISLFSVIIHHRQSDSYVTVCAILSLDDAALTRAHYQQLQSSGIDPSGLLLRDGLIGFFLEGTWQDKAGHAFTVGEDMSVVTNIPWQQGRYYDWRDGALIMNMDDDTDIEAFRFAYIDMSTITLYCCENGQTYTLSRGR